MSAATLTSGPIIIDLESVWRDAWALLWDDLGHLAAEGMPEVHSYFLFGGSPCAGMYTVRKGDGVPCQCFSCRAHHAKTLSEIPVPVVGRNEPCPCLSGRKYKKCHGRAT